ncbi:MAG: peptide deformylase [Planctomycetota bacterium]|jgi:peptide deformylase|nr:peptide deformylase [Planctomycetota bacterium]MDP6519036.1 peptide deformylase [Planctomycetota bacterium]MDP6838740.1 peptide deformylase [Planctomycetota bacterium]MDP6955151.1 peptide deformylase [Planctomycetota bacterium]
MEDTAPDNATAEASKDADLAASFNVIPYPNPVLRQPAEEVTAFDEALQDTVKAMFARMRASEGVGLAAPQVGISQRILVINATGAPEDDLVLINPTLVERSGPETLFDEGCLSFPGIYAQVRRPDRCAIEAQDSAGKPLRASFEGFLSRVVQHEFDHLEGVLLVDRMSPADKLKNKAALGELVEAYRRTADRATRARRQ